MRARERHKQIMDLLVERGDMAVLELVRALNASEATIRRDLTRLQSAGKLIRTPGGARPLAEASLVIRTFQEKAERMRGAKEQIARRAVELVKPGMVLALDSGTTVWRMAALLKNKAPLTVLTNGLAVIEELGAVPGITIYCAGGRLNAQNLDFVGNWSIWGALALRADLAFLGADSLIPGQGLFSADEASAQSSAALAACAVRRIVLADSTKINARGCYRVLAAHEIHTVVLDAGVTKALVRQLRHDACQLLIAP